MIVEYALDAGPHVVHFLVESLVAIGDDFDALLESFSDDVEVRTGERTLLSNSGFHLIARRISLQVLLGCKGWQNLLDV